MTLSILTFCGVIVSLCSLYVVVGFSLFCLSSGWFLRSYVVSSYCVMWAFPSFPRSLLLAGYVLTLVSLVLLQPCDSAV